MGLIKKEYVEISHLTHDNQESFGITHDQVLFINDLLYRCSSDVHGKVLDNLYSNGVSGIRYKITSSEAGKLITNLLNNYDFSFVEYNSQEWHKLKLEEVKLKLTKNYVNYDIHSNTDLERSDSNE